MGYCLDTATPLWGAQHDKRLVVQDDVGYCLDSATGLEPRAE